MTSWLGKRFPVFGIFERSLRKLHSNGSALAGSSVAEMYNEYNFFFSCSFCWEESKNISLSLEFNTFISICLDVHLFFFISQDFDVTF